MEVCQGQLQIYQASHLSNTGGGVATNGGIVQKINILDLINLHNLKGVPRRKVVGD